MYDLHSLDNDDKKLQAALMKCWDEEKLKGESDGTFPSRRIRKKRAARLRRQNYSSASIQVLPAELLSAIFLYICADETFDRNNRRNIFLLASICSQWRALVLGMTSLWSRMTLVVNIDPYENLELLQYYLDHARLAPFALRLLFLAGSERSSRRMSAIEGVLMEDRNRNKIKTLRVESFPFTLSTYLSRFQSICHLEMVGSPHYQSSYTQTANFVNLTNLNRIELSSTGCPLGVQFPWTQIISLTLKSEHIDVCVWLFSQCSNLREFRCFSPQKSKTQRPTQPQIDHFTFETAEALTWTFDPDPICTTLFSKLRLPSLRSLEWYSHSYRRPIIRSEEASALRNLFSSSTFTLSRLQLHHAGLWPIDFIQNILSHAWNLRVLHLTKCKYQFVIDTLSVLKHDDGGLLLPLLDQLIIQDPEGSMQASERKNQEIQLASHIVPLFQSRDPEKKKSFSLQIIQTSGLRSKDMFDVYEALRSEGHAFNMWVNSAMTCSVEEYLAHEKRWVLKKSAPEALEANHSHQSHSDTGKDGDDEPKLAYSVD